MNTDISVQKTLLITGFEPFDGQDINPSWEAVRLLPDRIGNYKLIKQQIPVEYGTAAAAVSELAEKCGADTVLCIGQAGGRSAVTPEVIGINLREASIADNAGFLAQGVPIVPQGPAAYFATVPVRDMVKAISLREIPGKLSYSAGAYVCNDVLYSLLHHFRGSHTRVGFIHVPWLPQQGEPGLALDEIIAALTAAIGVL